MQRIRKERLRHALSRDGWPRVRPRARGMTVLVEGFVAFVWFGWGQAAATGLLVPLFALGSALGLGWRPWAQCSRRALRRARRRWQTLPSGDSKGSTSRLRPEVGKDTT